MGFQLPFQDACGNFRAHSLEGFQPMRQILRATATLAAILLSVGPAAAAPSGAEICKKMIREGRANGMDQRKCLCAHRLAEATLDDDITALLFDSWYRGVNNMSAIERLPNQSRVKKQIATMALTLETRCK
ncbi:hypothetical protein [Gemmobacter caeni]|nr:hypothetical protein [Gemmobacter caeni]